MRRRRHYSRALWWALTAALVVLFQPAMAEKSIAELFVEGAKAEVAKRTVYHEAYRMLEYPGGDVPANEGVCTDLVIRAFRNAGLDLQQLLHEDRKAHPEDYPTHIWEYKKPDKNIDHRRCQNLYAFFKKFSKEQTTSTAKENWNEWKPGDIVFFQQKGRQNKFPWHVGIISDQTTKEGVPIFLHLFPPHAMATPLNEFPHPVHSHFRWP